MFYNIRRLYDTTFYYSKIWDIDQILCENRELINSLDTSQTINNEKFATFVEKTKQLSKKINYLKIMYDRDHSLALTGRTDKELNSLMKEFGVRKRKKPTKDISKEELNKKKNDFYKLGNDYYENCIKIIDFLADKHNETEASN